MYQVALGTPFGNTEFKFSTVPLVETFTSPSKSSLCHDYAQLALYYILRSYA